MQGREGTPPPQPCAVSRRRPGQEGEWGGGGGSCQDEVCLHDKQGAGFTPLPNVDSEPARGLSPGVL